MTTIDRDQLVESAMDFADRALKAYTEDDRRVILQNAAISMEHVSKAFLADLHPTLLMEIRNGQFDSLLYLAGFGQKAKKAEHPRTISAREALNRVRHVLPALKAPKTELDQLIDVRDGIVHVGYLAEANTREILTAFARLTNELYEELDVPAEQRWGSHTDLVNSLISRSLTEIEHEAQRKIAAAKRFFVDLMDKIPVEAQDSVGSARQAEWPRMLPGEDYGEDIHCPACNDHEAKCFGVVETDYDPDVMVEDGYATVVGTGAVHTFHPRRLICGICNLQLDNPDELKAAGVEMSWILEDYVEEP